MSLNFRDCHAKIRQVDSQSTIDKAVVVQVISSTFVVCSVIIVIIIIDHQHHGKFDVYGYAKSSAAGLDVGSRSSNFNSYFNRQLGKPVAISLNFSFS